MTQSRLALGTARFGMPYGIAGRGGAVSRDEAAAILRDARSAGLDTLDTAITYGDSERRLGELGVRQWQVVTKLPAIPDSCADVASWVTESVHGSLSRLGIASLYALLLHHPGDLLGPRGEALWSALRSLSVRGLVGKVGASLHRPDELDAMWARFRFEIVQTPLNVLDRRFAMSGWLRRLREAGTEIHVRSVFLQGLLLMGREELPARFEPWRPLWRRWHDWLADVRLTPAHACLSFALSHGEADRVVLGVGSASHLRELVSVSGGAVMPPAWLMTEDPRLIYPSNWSVPG